MQKNNLIIKYGIHIIICMVVIIMASYMNHQINMERSHQYKETKGLYTFYREITGVEENGSWTIFIGWGFDEDYYNESVICEIILRNVETEETLWPEMEKTEDTVIEEKYTNGIDYSAGGFKGRIKTNRMPKEDVYEILLRYTCNLDENEQEYVKTVTTDKYFYNGVVTNYNPKIFVEPDIKGAEFEDVIKNAEVFHYFPEGMWVYRNGDKLYLLFDEEMCVAGIQPELPVFWYTQDEKYLPIDRKEFGYGYIGNYIKNRSFEIENGVCFVAIELPDVPITQVQTGLYLNGETGWEFECRKQF